MGKARPRTAPVKRPPTPEPRDVICPHQHFKYDIVDRDILSRKQHLNLLCTPKGYRWVVIKEDPSDLGPDESATHPCRVVKKKPGKTYVHNILAELWGLLTPEMVNRLKEMLMVEFGLSEEAAVEFICHSRHDTLRTAQRNKRKKALDEEDEQDYLVEQDPTLPRLIVEPKLCDKSQFAVGIDPCHIREFSRIVSTKFSEYVVAMMCARRNNRHRRMAEVILNGLCDLTGENTSLDEPKNRLHKILTITSDRVALWLAQNMDDEDNKRHKRRKNEDAVLKKKRKEKQKEQERRRKEKERMNKEIERNKKRREKEERDEERKKREEDDKKREEKEKRRQELEKFREDHEKRQEANRKAEEKRKEEEARKKEEERKRKEEERRRREEERKKKKKTPLNAEDENPPPPPGPPKPKPKRVPPTPGKPNRGKPISAPSSNASSVKSNRSGTVTPSRNRNPTPRQYGPNPRPRKYGPGPGDPNKRKSQPNVNRQHSTPTIPKIQPGGPKPIKRTKSKAGVDGVISPLNPSGRANPSTQAKPTTPGSSQGNNDNKEGGPKDPKTPASPTGPKTPGGPTDPKTPGGPTGPKTPGVQTGPTAPGGDRDGPQPPKTSKPIAPGAPGSQAGARTPTSKTTAEDKTQNKALEQRIISVTTSQIGDTKPISTPRQETLQDILNKELEKRIEPTDKETSAIIREVASKTATWIDQNVKDAEIEYGSRDKLARIPPVSQKPKGPLFNLRKIDPPSRKYDVRTVTYTEAGRKIRTLRRHASGRNVTSAPTDPSDPKMWAKWAENASEMADDWGHWIDKTIQDAEDKAVQYQSKSKEGNALPEDEDEWNQFVQSTNQDALSWRRMKKSFDKAAKEWKIYAH